MKTSNFLIGLTAFTSLSQSTYTTKSNLKIQTSSGEVHGFINASFPLVRQFHGIPYAEPPLGSLRFAAPVAKSKSNSPIIATKYGASCMQQFGTGKTHYTELMREFLIEGPQSEDCLFLSIWAPKKAERKKLPVFVYIPGGGFTGGGTNSPAKFPSQWVQETQGHIVVILNYRLNVFGFPNARGAEQNLGLLDQRKAVEWTHKNIAAFGGDPSKITLWGQSAGGSSAATYAFGYPENPLVRAIIADSGSANIGRNNDRTQSNFTALAGLVGCGGLEAQPELDCVRKVDAVTLENTLSNYINSGATPSLRFAPYQDEKLVFSNTTERLLQGKVAKIPYIMGTNSNEGAAWWPFTVEGPTQAWINEVTERLMECPTAREVRSRSLAGYTTYRYQYRGNFSNISPLPWIGASHSTELPLLFGTHDDFRGPSTKFEVAVSNGMQNLWLDFASNPKHSPSTKGFTWSQHRDKNKRLAVFAKDNKVVQWGDGGEIDERCRARGLFP